MQSFVTASGVKASGVKASGVKDGEAVILAWITERSKSHRNAVNKKVMADPRIRRMLSGEHPFDMQRMFYGGFRPIVDLAGN